MTAVWLARLMRVIVGLALASFLMAGCAGEVDGTASDRRPSSAASTSASAPPRGRDASQDGPATESPSPSSPARRGRVVKVAASDYGPMLFDRSGQAIYLFDREHTSSPRCYGGCARAWPPVLTEGRPRGVGAARSGLLGTTRRKDGSRQVTYAGHPLYFYAHEGKNEVLCHNVSEFGGLWQVVTPAGEPAA